MKISNRKFIGDNGSSSYRNFVFRSFLTRKSLTPLVFGILIGFCFSKLWTFAAFDYFLFNENNNRINLGFTNKNDEFSSISFNSSSKEIKTEHNHENKNGTIADNLYNEVRILCWVMTNSTNHESKARYVKQTWGTRCNKLIFMSDEEDEDLGSIDLNVGYGRDVLWGKTKAAFKYIYNNSLDDADWFLKADDDTYVILENLRYLLYSYKPEYPIYFGCKFKQYVSQGYMSGGAGYVLSKEAVKRFVETGLSDKWKCREDNGGAEDLEIGKCLENVGVIAGDSRDSSGRRRFFPSGPDSHYSNILPNKDLWYWKYSYYNISEGLNCCSDYAISFHYVKPQQMYFLDYAIYHIKTFGITYSPVKLPDKISTTDFENIYNHKKNLIRKLFAKYTNQEAGFNVNLSRYDKY